jgi:flagellar biogenesis protein FliO
MVELGIGRRILPSDLGCIQVGQMVLVLLLVLSLCYLCKTTRFLVQHALALEAQRFLSMLQSH